MSTPTPTPINDTPLNNIFSFIGLSVFDVQLIIIGGIIVTVLLIILHLRNRRH